MSEAKAVKVTLVASPIGQTERQRQTLRGLGLTRMNKTVQVRTTPANSGMLRKIAHLVRVEG